MMESEIGVKDDVKVENLEEEDQLCVEFAGATLAIHSDNEISPFYPTVDEKLATHEGGDNASSASKAEPQEEEGTTTFFSTRTGAFENAVSACRPVILPNIDGEYCGAWLLTEIDHWDAEKERIILLTKLSLLIIKYDFIALKVLDYKRVSLAEFDRVLIGNFTYPETSVVPKVSRMVDLVKNLAFNWSTSRSQKTKRNPKSGALCVHSVSKHRPTKGIRAMWNKGERIDRKESWNPWSRSIPYVTFTSHPYSSVSPDDDSAIFFDIDHFIRAFIRLLDQLENPHCVIEEQPILIESYLGLVSMFHNVNNLGFFKLRGKVSF